MNSAPFTATAPGITLAVTSTASTGVALPGVSGQGNVVRIVNEGGSIVFFDLATTLAGAIATLPTTGAGTTDCVAVLPSSDVLFTRNLGDLYISAICRAAGTATLSIYVGEGTN